MRLRPVQTGGADFFPQKRDGVQPDEPGAVPHIKQQRRQGRQQHLGILEIQVYLVRAEGGPHFPRPGGGWEFGEQGQRTRPDDLRKIGIAGDHDKEIAERWIITKETLKPFALRGQMIEHRIEHQIKFRSEPPEVRPCAIRRFNREIVLHRKTIVRGPGIKRQQMNAADHFAQMPRGERRQRAQGGLARLVDLVRVGDEQGVVLG